jgi:hypothetical protein
MKEAPTSRFLWHQPEGGYDPLVSIIIQLKTSIELSLAHLVSKCLKKIVLERRGDHTLDLNVA